MQNEHLHPLVDTEDKVSENSCDVAPVLPVSGHHVSLQPDADGDRNAVPSQWNNNTGRVWICKFWRKLTSPKWSLNIISQFGDGKIGIINRNDIGFLLWTQTDIKTENVNLGSRLKTPVLPIWVTCVNDQWGILFNPNKDLMKSYAAENR